MSPCAKGAAFVVLVASCLFSCAKSKVATDRPRPDPADAEARSVKIDAALVASGRVKFSTASRRAPSTELRVPGEVRASEDGSAEASVLVAGRIASLEVKEGSSVKRGDVLAWVDAPEAARAASELMRSRARAAFTQRKLERQLELEKQSATSPHAVDEARAESNVARADLAASRTLLLNLGVPEPPADASPEALTVRVPVRAPIAGVVAKRDAVLGAPVTPDRTLFRIVAADKVFVSANIPETVSPSPSPGASAELAARGDPARRCTAIVTGSLGVVQEATRSVAVRVQPAKSCVWLVPGGYVDVVFAGVASTTPELVIPAEAVIDVNGSPTVFVKGPKDGEFLPRGVRVRLTGGPDAVVEAGVAESELVVTSGALLLKGELLRSALEAQ